MLCRDRMLPALLLIAALIGVANTAPRAIRGQTVMTVQWVSYVNDAEVGHLSDYQKGAVYSSVQGPLGPINQVSFPPGSTTEQPKSEPQPEPQTEATPEPQAETEGDELNFCKHPEVDAAVRTNDGITYFFKGDYYWRKIKGSAVDLTPRKISEDWSGLPGNLDAAYTSKEGKTYFFKGTNYWAFVNQVKQSGYPRAISDGFPGLPDNLDAAVRWGKNNKPYFFKGSSYWLFDSGRKPPVSSSYPASITAWNGIWNRISASLRWDDNATYLFDGKKYYKYDDDEDKIATEFVSYPRSTAIYIFGCSADACSN